MSKKLGIIWNYLAHYKYLIVIVAGVLVVGVVDDNSVRQHIKYQIEIATLRSEIEKYREQYENDKRTLRDMQHGARAFEKIARQRYFMKADDEDIFVLSSDIPEKLTNKTKMKQLSKLESAIFLLGGVLMVVGAACFAFGFSHPQLVQVTSWGFLLGTILFSVMQAMQFYEGPSLVIHRLKRMQYVADIFFVLSGISMVDTVYAFLRRWFENYETYITYFYNKWVVFLLIAALLELYTTHRISHELKKENNQ